MYRVPAKQCYQVVCPPCTEHLKLNSRGIDIKNTPVLVATTSTTTKPEVTRPELLLLNSFEFVGYTSC